MKTLSSSDYRMLHMAGFTWEEEIVFPDVTPETEDFHGLHASWTAEDMIEVDELHRKILFLNFIKNETVWIDVEGVRQRRLVGPWEVHT